MIPPRASVLGLALAIGGGAALCACGGGTGPATGSGGTGSATSGGGNPPPSGAQERTATITIHNFAFQPAHDTVAAGEKVTVVNKDSVTHTLTSTTGAFNTGDIGPGASKTFTAPSKAGTYDYRCNIHQFMTGTLIVR